jgi:hypothetical protein
MIVFVFWMEEGQTVDLFPRPQHFILIECRFV